MRSGDGVNNALLSVCDHIRHEVSGAAEAKAVIFPYLQQARQGRSLIEIERELNRQIETAYVGFIKGDAALTITAKPARKQPVTDYAAIERITSTGPGVYDLWERSPVRFTDDLPHTDEVIDGLFADDEYITVGLDTWQITHERREHLLGKLADFSFIVPAVMCMEGGFTEKGKGHHSFRCDEAVKTRRFVVIEFDKIWLACYLTY